MSHMLLETVTIIGGERVTDLTIAEGLIYALLGFIVTFIGIVVLIALLWAVGKIMGAVRKKRSETKTAEKAETASEDELSPEIKAALIAAIAAYYEGEKPQCEFKVKRIKRL